MLFWYAFEVFIYYYFNFYFKIHIIIIIYFDYTPLNYEQQRVKKTKRETDNRSDNSGKNEYWATRGGREGFDTIS
jgi:hypothetical protein